MGRRRRAVIEAEGYGQVFWSCSQDLTAAEWHRTAHTLQGMKWAFAGMGEVEAAEICEALIELAYGRAHLECGVFLLEHPK